MTNEIIRSNRLELLKNEVFGALDVTDATRNEYRVRITHFIRYAETHGINRNSYLDYKRYLAGIDTFSVSTKNKYLIAAKIFLDGLHRLNLIPQKITDHVRGFTQCDCTAKRACRMPTSESYNGIVPTYRLPRKI